MKKLFASLALAFLIAPSAKAEPRLFSLREFSFEGYRLLDNRDGFYPYNDGQEKWANGTAVNFNLDLVKVGDWGIRWDNQVRGETTNSQYRAVGWQFETAFDMGQRFSLFWDHHSQHALDAYVGEKFPLRNVIGGRINFYKRDK
jgi:hypothetical protein